MKDLKAQAQFPANPLDYFELIALLHGADDFVHVSLVAAGQEQIGFVTDDPSHPAQQTDNARLRGKLWAAS